MQALCIVVNIISVPHGGTEIILTTIHRACIWTMHRVYTEYSYPAQAILCWTLCTHGGTEIILTTIHRGYIWTMHRVYREYSYPAQAILC